MLSSLTQIEDAIRASWCRETCDPVDLDEWSESNPAKGQCGVTALVIQDLLGGELLIAEVRHADGSRQGVHYWNRLSCGTEIDLTRTQFANGELIGRPGLVTRPRNTDEGRMAEQYRLLAGRVASQLARTAA
jgi:hypothetical protein